MYWQLHPSEIEGWLCTARADAHLAVTELLKQKLHLPAAAQQLWNLTGLLAAMRGEPRVCFRFNGIPHDGPWNTALGGEKEVKIHSAQSKKKKKKASLDHEKHFGWEKVHQKSVKRRITTRVNREPWTKSARFNRTLIQHARLQNQAFL